MDIEQLVKVSDWEQLPDELKMARLDHTPADDWVQTVSYIADSLKQYEREQWEDYQGEIADGLVPIYTSEKWKEMNDLSLWAVSEVESDAYELLGGAEDDGDPLFKVIDAYLYAYYYRAVGAVIEYINEQEEEDNE